MVVGTMRVCFICCCILKPVVQHGVTTSIEHFALSHAISWNASMLSSLKVLECAFICLFVLSISSANVSPGCCICYEQLFNALLFFFTRFLC